MLWALPKGETLWCGASETLSLEAAHTTGGNSEDAGKAGGSQTGRGIEACRRNGTVGTAYSSPAVGRCRLCAGETAVGLSPTGRRRKAGRYEFEALTPIAYSIAA